MPKPVKKSPARAGKTPAGQELKRLHAIFKGRVQGVGFRNYVETAAQAHAVTGWVRNLPKGDVEMVAEGGRADLAALMTDIRGGRLGANIERCVEKWAPHQGSFAEFCIEYFYG